MQANGGIGASIRLVFSGLIRRKEGTTNEANRTNFLISVPLEFIRQIHSNRGSRILENISGRLDQKSRSPIQSSLLYHVPAQRTFRQEKRCTPRCVDGKVILGRSGYEAVWWAAWLMDSAKVLSSPRTASRSPFSSIFSRKRTMAVPTMTP